MAHEDAQTTLKTLLRTIVENAEDRQAAEIMCSHALQAIAGAGDSDVHGGEDTTRLITVFDSIATMVAALVQGEVEMGKETDIFFQTTLGHIEQIASAADPDVLKRAVRSWVPVGIDGTDRPLFGQEYELVGLLAATYTTLVNRSTKAKVLETMMRFGEVDAGVFDSLQTLEVVRALVRELKSKEVAETKDVSQVLLVMKKIFANGRPLSLQCHEHLDEKSFASPLELAVRCDPGQATEQIQSEDMVHFPEDGLEGHEIAQNAMAVILACNGQFPPKDPFEVHHSSLEHVDRMGHPAACSRLSDLSHWQIIEPGSCTVPAADAGGDSPPAPRVQRVVSPLMDALGQFPAGSDLGSHCVAMLNRQLEPVGDNTTHSKRPALNSVLKFLGDACSSHETGAHFLYVNDLFVLVHVLNRELVDRDQTDPDTLGHLWVLWGSWPTRSWCRR